MEHTRKLILVPADTEMNAPPDIVVSDAPQIGGNAPVETVEKATNTEPKKKKTPKAKLLARILLKLAKHGAYNEEGQLNDGQGNFIEGSDVLSQIRIALLVQKPKTSSDLFIKLLKESGVTPDLLLNQTVREQLENFRESDWRNEALPVEEPSRQATPEPIQVDEQETVPHEEEDANLTRGKKRKKKTQLSPPAKRLAVDPNILKQLGWRTIGRDGTRSRKRLLRSEESRRTRKQRKIV